MFSCVLLLHVCLICSAVLCHAACWLYEERPCTVCYTLRSIWDVAIGRNMVHGAGSVDGLVEASRQSRVCGGAPNEIMCAIFRVLMEVSHLLLSSTHVCMVCRVAAPDLTTACLVRCCPAGNNAQCCIRWAVLCSFCFVNE